MAMAEPYFYPMKEENGFLPDVRSIPDEVADRAKFMIVSLPSNPMGSVGNDTVYRELIAFAKKHDVLIVHDNAYSDIIFDGNTGRSFLHYEGAMEVGVEFFSLSKSFDVTGARLSFLIGRPDIVNAFYKLRSQYDFGMFLPLQKAAIAALRGSRESVLRQNEEYQRRRDALCGGFRAIGWDIPDSHGSMFVWAKIPSRYQSSMDFCMDLMEKSGVICTPGSSFGPMGEGYVRFALVLPSEKIREVIQAVDACGILREE
jgi:LL-diaminopimelate aminotransferase